MVAPPVTFPGGGYFGGSLRSSGAIMRLVGKGGIEAISRLMGFLLVCMGVQFIINGILEIIKTCTLKKARMGLSTIASVLRVSLASGEI